MLDDAAQPFDRRRGESVSATGTLSRALRRSAPLAIPRLSPAIVLVSGVAVYQLYVPVAGAVHVTLWLILAMFYPAVSLVVGLPLKRSFSNPTFLGLMIILLAFTAALLPSSDRMLGVKMIIWTGAALIAYLIGFQIGARGRAESLLLAVVLWMSPVALANIIFFSAAAWEEAFFSSRLARFLIEPDTLSSLHGTGFGFNVLHPLKAGTLFVNANIASIFFGIGLCTSLFLWHRRRSKAYLILVILMFLAFLATGSRAGLVGAAASTMAVLVVLGFRVRARRLLASVAIATLGVILVLVLPYSRFAVQRILGLSQNLDARLLIWYHAVDVVRHHPLTGVGFGGWQASFSSFARNFGLDPSLPPHNAYLIAWLSGGLPGFIGMLVLFAGSVYSLFRLSRNPELLGLAVLGCAILVWVGVQLLFTNFALADPRLGSVFLLSLGAVLGGLLRQRMFGGKASSIL